MTTKTVGIIIGLFALLTAVIAYGVGTLRGDAISRNLIGNWSSANAKQARFLSDQTLVMEALVDGQHRSKSLRWDVDWFGNLVVTYSGVDATYQKYFAVTFSDKPNPRLAISDQIWPDLSAKSYVRTSLHFNPKVP